MKKKESLELELQILNEKSNLTKRQLRKKEKLISKIQRQMKTDELLQQKNKTEIDNKQVSEDILNSNNKSLQNIDDENKVESLDFANDSSKLNINQPEKNNDIKIKNHILYLSSDDLIDLYLHSTVGTDERVYLSHALLDKYQISNPDVEFVNVNGVNIPVEKFGDIAFKDPKYVLENHDVPKDDEEKLNELKNLTAENDESLANDVDLLAKEQPITPILDDDIFLQEKYNMLKNVEINDNSSVPTNYLTHNQYANDLGYKYYYRDGFNVVKTSPDDFISNVTYHNTKNNLNKILPVKDFSLMKAELVSPNFINNSKSPIKEDKIDNSINNQYKDLPENYLRISNDNGRLPSDYYLNEEEPSIISKVSNKEVDNSLNQMLPISYFVNKNAIMVSPNNATNSESKSFKKLSENSTYSTYSDLPKAYWNKDYIEDVKNNNNLNNFVSKSSFIDSKSYNNILSESDFINKSPIMVSPNVASKDKNNSNLISENNLNNHARNFINQDLPKQYLNINFSDGKLPDDYY